MLEEKCITVSESNLYRAYVFNSIIFVQDSKAVIDKYKSGFPIPADIPFEDLSNSSVIDTSNANGTPKNSLDNRKGTVSDKKKNRKDKKGGGGLFGIFTSSKVFINGFL